MKKLVLVLFLLALPLRAATPSDADLKELIQKYYAAWSTGSSQNADKFYAKDADLVYFDVAPFEYKGWEAYKAGSQKYFLDTTNNVQFHLNDDLQIHHIGKDAFWMTITFTLTGDGKDGSKVSIKCRQSDVWEKRGNDWLIVQEHISTPLPGIGE